MKFEHTEVWGFKHAIRYGSGYYVLPNGEIIGKRKKKKIDRTY